MSYGNIPVIIPILATGYLLTVYLLLLLAQRHTREANSGVIAAAKTLHHEETPVTGKAG